MEQKTKNMICNFRAQNDSDWDTWCWFKDYCSKNGITICRPVLAFVQTFRKMIEGLDQGKMERPELINAFPVLVQLKQQNTFIYQTEKPRRSPSQTAFGHKYGTATIPYLDSYIENKARWLWVTHGLRAFCFRDFGEINHATFRKAVCRMIKKGILQATLPRSNPRTYFLTDPTIDWGNP